MKPDFEKDIIDRLFCSDLKDDLQNESHENQDEALTLALKKALQDLPECHPQRDLSQAIFAQTSQKVSGLQLVKERLLRFLKPVVLAPSALALVLATVFLINQGQLENSAMEEDLVATQDMIRDLLEKPAYLPDAGFELSRYREMTKPNLIRNVAFGLGEENSRDAQIAQEYSDEYIYEHLNPSIDEKVATFKFQRALRLRNKGDHESTAELLGTILKEHPKYSRNADVLTIRIDSLFQIKSNYEALKELSYLKGFDKERAEILEQRWLKK